MSTSAKESSKPKKQKKKKRSPKVRVFKEKGTAINKE
jgi:hypothetical protein